MKEKRPPTGKTTRHRDVEWCCGLCRANGGGLVCPNCSSPRMRIKGGLLLPMGEGGETGRAWGWLSEQKDPPDFIFPTEPVTEGKVTLHTNVSFDEDERIEFKEAGFLSHMPSYNQRYEQPQDWFAKGRWRRQPRAPLPELRDFQPSHPIKQKTICQYLTDNQPLKNNRAAYESSFLYLAKELAGAFPEGRHLCKKVQPYFHILLVENIVAMLNSPMSQKDGELYLGIADGGMVLGIPLTPRQRREILYLSNRVLLTIFPPLAPDDVKVSFMDVYSDEALQCPIINHCVIKFSISLKNPHPLYLHPRVSRSSTGTITWNPMLPTASVRRFGSVRKLTNEQIKTHLYGNGGTAGGLYDLFFKKAEREKLTREPA